ncbi:MAG: hypothetical protein CVV44_11565 [Spirochaetae bacterium HGW-Spirochaetae-1]|nr:MAG: hypothetical protein CVV44_11565 [Spirochaetae bacterium HGW-Spirochaetae-1]
MSEFDSLFDDDEKESHDFDSFFQEEPLETDDSGLLKDLHDLIDFDETGSTEKEKQTTIPGTPEDKKPAPKPVEKKEEKPPLWWLAVNDEFAALDKTYHESMAQYYRTIVRKDDLAMIRRIHKIPDNWKDFGGINDASLNLSEYDKRRLSDMKNYKAWELKMESMNLHFISTAENVLLECLSHRPVPFEEIDEARDSINQLIMEVERNPDNFKYLFLSLAKRAISDFYYLMNSTMRFYQKSQFDFRRDTAIVLQNWVTMMNTHKNLYGNIETIKTLKKSIDPYFKESSTPTGYKMDDVRVRKYLESIEKDAGFITSLLRGMNLSRNLLIKMRNDYRFLLFYYNGKDGKLYRYNYVIMNFEEKLKNGIITKEIFNGFKDIRDAFMELKNYIESMGLIKFGTGEFTYLTILEFTYKSAKFFEAFLLRKGQYEKLSDLRSDVLYYVEKEMELHSKKKRG